MSELNETFREKLQREIDRFTRHLPTHDEAETQIKALGAKASALHRMVYEFEPAGIEQETKFRNLLSELLAEALVFNATRWIVDAARYNYLRKRDIDTIQQGGVFIGLTPDNRVLNEADADRAVDAAIAAEHACGTPLPPL